MSDRHNPFEHLEELFNRLNRQFGEAARDWEREVGGRGQFEFGAGSTSLDLADHGDEFVVTVDVPGYDAGDLTSSLSGKTLFLSGERTHEAEAAEDTYLRREREMQSFSRQVELPEPVDLDGVEAAVHNGVLTLTLPKLEPSDESHTIDID
jgi:HSP20 family protein